MQIIFCIPCILFFLFLNKPLTIRNYFLYSKDKELMGGSMQKYKIFSGFLFAIWFTGTIFAQAHIGLLDNQTDFEFQVVGHQVLDECSVFTKNMDTVRAHTKMTDSILLGAVQPNFVMRPVAYIDPHSKKRYVLVNTDFAYDSKSLEAAFGVWEKVSKQKNKYKTAQEWFEQYVGGDILLTLKQTEVYGYIVNMSQVVLGNNIRSVHDWVEWGVGIFARLIIDITVKEDVKKGIVFELHTRRGSQGAYCSSQGQVTSF